MPDLSSVAREAAGREAERHWPTGREYSTAQTSAVFSVKELDAYCASALTRGFTECASRLPSREELAAVLRRHNFDELLLGNIEWDGYTAVCACGWSSEEYKMPGEAHEAHSEHASANVLALIGEKISG